MEWELLATTLGDIEANIISGLLKSSGIPVMHQYPGISGLTRVYMGSSFEVEIYVPSQNIQEAKKLLSQLQNEIEKGDSK
mgnify:CR=1 FL=1